MNLFLGVITQNEDGFQDMLVKRLLSAYRVDLLIRSKAGYHIRMIGVRPRSTQ